MTIDPKGWLCLTTSEGHEIWLRPDLISTVKAPSRPCVSHATSIVCDGIWHAVVESPEFVLDSIEEFYHYQDEE